MFRLNHQYQSDGTYLIRIEGQLEDKTIFEIVDMISQIYQPNQATFITIDLRDNYILPLRLLASEIKRCYREYAGIAPLYLAIVTEVSVAQVMTTVLKTLMRRDPIQLFTDVSKANQWLMLERNNLDA